MALEADWGSSTVLEAFPLTAAVGFLAPGNCVAAVCGARVSRACLSRQSVRYVTEPAGRESLRTQN